MTPTISVSSAQKCNLASFEIVAECKNMSAVERDTLSNEICNIVFVLITLIFLTAAFINW